VSLRAVVYLPGMYRKIWVAKRLLRVYRTSSLLPEKPPLKDFLSGEKIYIRLLTKAKNSVDAA